MAENCIKSILDHRSVRQYKPDPISNEDKEILLQVAQSVPTSMHAQGYSIILVEDKEMRKQLAHLSGEQVYVETSGLFFVIAMDFYRTSEALKAQDEEQVIQHSAEGLITGSLDVGIVLGSLVIAAEALGYGTVPIGGIRRDPEKVIELLGLPLYTFPLVGLCIGIPEAKSAKKPRLPRESVIFQNQYNKESQQNAIREFDKTSRSFNLAVRNLDKSWSESLASIHSTVYYPKVFESLKKQGFTMDR